MGGGGKDAAELRRLSNLKAVLHVVRDGERSEDRVEAGEEKDGGRGCVESLAVWLR